MRGSAQSSDFQMDILTEILETLIMMFVTPRCNYAGPLGKQIPTRSFLASLFARIAASRVRW